jgi:hypothetical protein
VTDPRLHSTEPIDDEIPFEDALAVRREEAPSEEDAIVTPAAAEREQRREDQDRERSRPATERVEDEPS